MDYTAKTNIKAWAEEDRPREKMLLKGKSTLSEAELLAIIISSGSQEHSAVELSKIILSESNNNLNDLAKLSINDLQKFKGIGEAKAISIVAALELGRRRKNTDSLEKPRIKKAADAYNYLKQYMLDLDHEQFWIILLKRNLEIIKAVQISAGGVAGTVVDIKIIFKHVVENLASGIVLSHNHPSGNLNPSKQDEVLTMKIKQSADIMDIILMDHVIFTDNGFFSFQEEGLL